LEESFLHFESLLSSPVDERLLSLIAADSDCFFFAYSPERRSLIAWTKNTEKVLGVKESAVARDGNLFLRHVHPDDRFTLFTDLEQGLKGTSPYRATYRWIRPDSNETHWLHCRATMHRYAQEPIFQGIIIDLTAEFTGTVGRIAGPDSLPTVMNALPTVVFTVDTDLRLLRINKPKGQIPFSFGDPQFRHEFFRIGKPLSACFSEETQKDSMTHIFRELLDGKIRIYRSRIVEPDGVVYNLEITPLVEEERVRGLLFFASDVTEIVSLERKLGQLHKTEGIRLLAAGVAHNFNNSLQSIVAQAAIAKAHASRPDLVVEAAQQIIDQVGRAAGLASQLAVVEAEDSGALQQVDLNLAVMEAISRVEELFSSGFKIAVAFGTPPNVLAKQELLADALEAILRNSAESMPEGGSLSVKTYQVQLLEHQVEKLAAGSYAKITIFDTGSGMPEAVRQRCLEPFFTTKELDSISGINLKGKGLGLSRALAVIRQFGGGLAIESQVGAGTTVSMYIPAEQNTSTFSKGAKDELQPQILIIDDDLVVLRTMQALIHDMGYRCAVTDDPKEAIELVKHIGSELQLILLDALMPHTDGATLLKQLRRVNREICIVGFTGAAPAIGKVLLEAGASELLLKPVLPATLKELLLRRIGECAS
jgi:signal transduction histidine kinase/ActR/RegA family two-component response regulator